MSKRIVIALGGNALGNNLPEQMVQNIAKGRLNKFFKESCLVDQEFQFGDGDKLNVAQWLQAQSKTLNVCDYRRYSLSAE